MPRDGVQTSSIGMIKALGATVLASIRRRGDAAKDASIYSWSRCQTGGSYGNKNTTQRASL